MYTYSPENSVAKRCERHHSTGNCVSFLNMNEFFFLEKVVPWMDMVIVYGKT